MPNPGLAERVAAPQRLVPARRKLISDNYFCRGRDGPARIVDVDQGSRGCYGWSIREATGRSPPGSVLGGRLDVTG